MDQPQFDQFLEAFKTGMREIRGADNNRPTSVKIPVLSSVDSSEFKIFRQNFELVAQLNGWDAKRSKVACKASLTGEAALLLHDIDIGADTRTLEQFLNLYENRLIAPAASAAAEVEFDHAKQLPAENVLTFHSRCRRLFLRAYPNTLPDALNGSRSLIRKFISGLMSVETQRYVYRQSPETFNNALELAQADEMSMLAVADSLDKAEKKVASLNLDGSMTVQAMGDAGKPSSDSVRRCFFPDCGSTAHLVKDCPKRKAAYGYFQKQRSTRNARGRGRGRGGQLRSRGSSTSGRGRSHNPRKVFVMEEVEVDDAEEYDYPETEEEEYVEETKN